MSPFKIISINVVTSCMKYPDWFIYFTVVVFSLESQFYVLTVNSVLIDSANDVTVTNFLTQLCALFI